MAKPYSMDLRERAIARVCAGESCRKVAALFKVGVSSVIKWKQRHDRTGTVKPGKMGGNRPAAILGEHREWLLARVSGDANVTLRGLAQELGARGVKVVHGTVGRFLQREGMGFKKNRASGRAKPAQDRPAPRALEGPAGQG